MEAVEPDGNRASWGVSGTGGVCSRGAVGNPRLSFCFLAYGVRNAPPSTSLCSYVLLQRDGVSDWYNFFLAGSQQNCETK